MFIFYIYIYIHILSMEIGSHGNWVKSPKAWDLSWCRADSKERWLYHAARKTWHVFNSG